ncbi:MULTISPECIES: CDF family zinc transporter ZitB [Pantoea]|jgi:cobalt-zinc-cadmium efflux system protein|uniref:CDF family zinc transporter ZitB n=1 Tax=Pantoea eucrina TaxID=472693 RepID=A0ABS1Z581_9GAMM|nr:MULTISPECIES: CDF family zinc transporter ZitB [Pantoea]AIX50616.1 zinc transporter ZitB [Pantoea sp. PSNIH1]PPS58229.1 cation transporter [Pantoea sp. BRM17]KAA6047962.1 CDF family zinc transporter ZitB [Pantoea sp. Bo_7]KAA6093207.1 CDF family zinc transporter ZitB [Pantoea sp. Bo_10]MBM0747153.1 CDF family zinc transporter ZitB [Pantoea eucrina]
MAHSHSHGDHNANRTRLAAAFSVTALFMLAEVIGGLLSGSLALLADAGHMLTDAAALLMALLAVQFARRKPNARHTFGLLRLTTLAAFVNAIALLVITVLIVWEAIRRFTHPQPIEGGLMLGIAIAGLFANLLSFWLLHRGSGEKNLNVRAAALHVMGDLLGSVGAIAAAVIVMLTGWTPIDPILSLLVSVLVVRSAWALLRESLHELLEGAPVNINIDKLARELKLNIDEVRNVHHIHLWQVGEKPVLTLHVQVVPPYDHDGLLRKIHHYLHQHYQIEHATVQMEYQACSLPDCALGSEHAADDDHHAVLDGHAHHHH